VKANQRQYELSCPSSQENFPPTSLFLHDEIPKRSKTEEQGPWGEWNPRSTDKNTGERAPEKSFSIELEKLKNPTDHHGKVAPKEEGWNKNQNGAKARPEQQHESRVDTVDQSVDLPANNANGVGREYFGSLQCAMSFLQ
jgi:hypothetical protein